MTGPHSRSHSRHSQTSNDLKFPSAASDSEMIPPASTSSALVGWFDSMNLDDPGTKATEDQLSVAAPLSGPSGPSSHMSIDGPDRDEDLDLANPTPASLSRAFKNAANQRIRENGGPFTPGAPKPNRFMNARQRARPPTQTGSDISRQGGIQKKQKKELTFAERRRLADEEARKLSGAKRYQRPQNRR
jgi:hypothetical protein